MTIHMRPYAGAADIQAIIALKQVCTTTQSMYDAPTVSDLRALLAPLPQGPAVSPPWEGAQGVVKRHLDRRAMTQRATALWEEADGQLLAYALFAFPGTILTFQVHPQARGSGLETEILTWAIERMSAGAQVRGKPLSLWCRCHESETGRRAALERAGFSPLPAEDLCLICLLDAPLPATTLPPGFALRQGVHGEEELEQYQDLHRVVFDGIGMGLDYHQSPAYRPDLDLIAVDVAGRFAAFCLCELHQVADSSNEYTAGEIGVIGTRPTHRKLGLGRALLLTGMHLLHEHGATRVFLETQQDNAPALHLFTSVGFRAVSALRWMTKEIAPPA